MTPTRFLPPAALLSALLTLSTASPTWAQPVAAGTPAVAPISRGQVKMERDEFLKSHRWDEEKETWVLKNGFEPPVGVRSRAEVKAARDDFLTKNRWDAATGGWVPIKGAPRSMSTMSRAQVKSETRQFVRSHHWDEISETWVDNRKRVKPM